MSSAAVLGPSEGHESDATRLGARPTLPERLESQSRGNAVVVSIGAAAALAAGAPWLLAVLGILPFVRLVFAFRRAFTPSGKFGVANLVTATRVVMTAAVIASGGTIARMGLVAVFLSIFALDGVDGWLARRTGSSSPIGAYFDMEADALFVLGLCFAVFGRTPVGPWVLVGGLLRYAYVLSLALVPARRGTMPRSRFARWSFVVLVLGLLLALAPVPAALSVTVAAIATGTVSWSFARSFYWSYTGESSRSAWLTKSAATIDQGRGA